MAIYRTKNYENMRKYLKRSLKINSSSSISYLLMEKFTSSSKPTDWQYISANEVKEKGIYPSQSYENFSNWRIQMVKKGILICMANKEEFDTKEPIHKANMFKYGPKVKKYIESELSSSVFERIDAKADIIRVIEVEDRVENVENKIEKLEKEVASLTALVLMAIPPDTPERRKIVEENICDQEKCFKLLKIAN